MNGCEIDQKLEDEITYLEYNLSRSQNELKRWVQGDLAKYKLTSKSDGARLEERIEVIEYELAHKMNDLHDLRKLINTFQGIEHQIVYKRYIKGKTFGAIANDLCYSLGYIKKNMQRLFVQ
ncbi:DNA-directed RNA polymerase specialized sigma24 family protein [Lysinibacillus parviboronicapiens]|uniref:DNA-directed RNA polymerase specialized sigma24 family protein n=1 Tax=Lysinibacillus parviboronicapiens TaxID=436516 RepID=A0ABV2PHK6_9BACI